MSHKYQSRGAFKIYLKISDKYQSKSAFKYWNKRNHLASICRQVVVPHHKHPTPWKDQNWNKSDISSNCSTRSDLWRFIQFLWSVMTPPPFYPPAQYIFTCGCYEWINNIYDLVQPTRKATPRYNYLLSFHKSSTFQNLTLPILPIVFHKEGMDFAGRKHKSLWGQMPRSIGAMLRLLQK